MRQWIVGSDWWTDCDDVIAMKLVAKAAIEKKIRLLGVGLNACMPQSVASLSNFLADCGLHDIPIGIDREAVDFGGTLLYQPRLAALSGGKPSNAEVPDAAALYIWLLSASEAPVEIIEIGYPQVLAKVLETAPELFKAKVSKIWMMAGKWDESLGKENNFSRNARAAKAAHYFCQNCPVPITFLGFEIGISVIVGSRLDHSGLLYQVMVDHGSADGRFAWDPMLVQMAVVGDEREAGYRLIRGTASVDVVSGENRFLESADGLHGYVQKLFPDDYYKDLINRQLE